MLLWQKLSSWDRDHMAYKAENIYYLSFGRKSLLISGSVSIKQYDELVLLLRIKNKFFIRKNYNF